MHCHYFTVQTVKCENWIKIHFSCHPEKFFTSCFSTIYYHLYISGICLPPETNDSNIFLPLIHLLYSGNHVYCLVMVSMEGKQKYFYTWQNNLSCARWRQESLRNCDMTPWMTIDAIIFIL